MKKKFAILALVLAVVLAGFLYLPRGGELAVANAATLAVISGDVEAQRSGSGFVPALDGELLAGGDVVRANRSGRAVLTFFDGSTLSVEPGAEVRVLTLNRTAGGGLQVTIEQLSGRTWASVQRLTTPDARFEVRTPTATATVRGTAFETIIEVIDGRPVTTIRTTEGEILVRAQGGGETIVRPGTEVRVPEGAPAPPAQPQPVTPRLALQSSEGVGFMVVDPSGRSCGSSGTTSRRQIPRCDVQGGLVTIGEVVSGSYAIVATAAQAAPGGSITAQGFRGQTRDFAVTFSRSMSVGDMVRTALPVSVAADGQLTAGAFAEPELVSSVCGAEARGRVFASGAVAERASALEAYGRAERGQPAAIIVTAAELSGVAANSTAGIATGGATISNVAVGVDAAGLRLSATVSAGPLAIAARGDIIAGASGGRLLVRIRSLDLGPIPGPVKDQLVPAVEKALFDFAATFPLVVERVSFRSGCLALIGTTPR